MLENIILNAAVLKNMQPACVARALKNQRASV